VVPLIFEFSSAYLFAILADSFNSDPPYDYCFSFSFCPDFTSSTFSYCESTTLTVASSLLSLLAFLPLMTFSLTYFFILSFVEVTEASE